MTSGPPKATGPRRRIWRRALAIEVALVLAVPLVLAGVVGFWQLNPVESETLSSVGTESHLLLQPFPDDSLIVEVAYQSSLGAPPNSSVATLLDRVAETCQKSQVTLDEHPIATSQRSYTDADLLAVEDGVRQHWPVPGTMSLFYLYTDGSYAPNPDVIGLAYRGSSIAVFGGTIDSRGGASASDVTTTVFVHEFGHELGLVGLVGSAPNEDPSHPYHSNDPNDVMYWAVDTTALTGLLSAPSTQFDAADLADLGTVKATPIFPELLPYLVLGVALLVALLLVVVEVRRRAGATRVG